MGRAAFLMVVALATAFGFVGISIRKSTNYLTEQQMGYYKYSQARNLARLGIHRYLRYKDRNLTAPTSVDFNGGTYYTTGTISNDTVRLTSKGTFSDSVYSMKCVLKRDVSPFPNKITGAVGVRATPVDFNDNGNPTIDGRNYTVGGDTLVNSGNLPGVATMASADSTLIASAMGSNLTGNPKAVVDTTTVDPTSFVDVYKANADYLYTGTSTTYTSMTWGSAANPVIVDCDNPDSLVADTFAGNTEGWGILIINGSLILKGNFKWHGLVVVYGDDNTVTAQAAMGTPQIIGALIMAGGPHTKLDIRGTAKFKYSSAALAQAKNIGKLLFYRVIEWYE